MIDVYTNENGALTIRGHLIPRENTDIPQEAGRVYIQLVPGLVVDVKSEDISEEQYVVDYVISRTIIQATIKPEGEIRASFKPVVLRLASAQGRGPGPATPLAGWPFSWPPHALAGWPGGGRVAGGWPF